MIGNMRTKSREGIAQRKFTILSDSTAKGIEQYGLLHAGGHGDEEIAIRTTLLIDPKGSVVWRRVSESEPVSRAGENWFIRIFGDTRRGHDG